MKYSRARPFAALAVLLASFACSKATPVAPSGSVLSISANPSQISLNGASTITIFGSKANGNPLDPGTVIRLSTNLGTIDATTTVKSGGTATAILQGDGRSGPATVTATTGAGMGATAMTMVQIGIATGQKPTLLVSASPSNVAVNGSAQVTVIARNSDGSSVGAGQAVLLTTTLGTLHPNSPQTNADGIATSQLNVGSQAGTATISAVLGSSDAATTMVTIRDAASTIGLVANPTSIIISGSSGSTTLTATVTNAQGLPVAGALVQFAANKSATFDHATNFTDSNGQATTMMTVQSGQVPQGGEVIHVTATTTSGTGAPLPASVDVPVS